MLDIHDLIAYNVYSLLNMAAVVKWLTHRIVAPAFVGSSPISRPIFWAIAKWLRHRTLTPTTVVRIHLAQPFIAGVAELADALDLGSSSSECRFDSCHPHQFWLNNTTFNEVVFLFYL